MLPKISTHVQILVLRDLATSNSRLRPTGLVFSHPANRNEGFKAMVEILNKTVSMFSEPLPLKLPKVQKWLGRNTEIRTNFKANLLIL